MSILWAESFDYYGNDIHNMTDGLWAEIAFSSSNSPFLTTAQARTGTHSLCFPRVGSAAMSNHFVRRVFGGPKTVVGVALAAYLTELPDVNGQLCIGQFRDVTNAIQISIYVDSTGIISCYRGEGSLIGWSGSPAITARAWNHIETKIGIHEATGFIEVRVNEVTVVNLTGLDTSATTAEVSQWVIGKPGTTFAADLPVWYVDDIVAWDDQVVGTNDVVDFIGDKKVFTALPNADTAEADFLKSAGTSGYELIDDLTPDDADYIYTPTDGATSTFGLTDLPANAAEVVAIVALPRVKKTDAGSVTFSADIVCGGLATSAAPIPATTVETYWPFVHTKNPSTGAPFAPAEFNAAELRIARATP